MKQDGMDMQQNRYALSEMKDSTKMAFISLLNYFYTTLLIFRDFTSHQLWRH